MFTGFILEVQGRSVNMHIPKVNLKNYISSVKTQKYSGGSMLASNMSQ